MVASRLLDVIYANIKPSVLYIVTQFQRSIRPMKPVRLFGVMLIALFALSAVWVSAASAADPEFTMLPTSPNFTSSGGLALLRSPTVDVDCKTTLNTGTVTGMDSVGSVFVTFHGCEAYFHGGALCGVISSTNQPAASGLITTNTLRGLLGLIDPSKGAGLLLEPVSGKVFVTLREACEAPETAVEGSIAGTVTTGKLQSTQKLTFEPSTAGGTIQTIKEILVLRGLVKPKLQSFAIAESSEEVSDIVEFVGAVEID
jgi:hypothetical protein